MKKITLLLTLTLSLMSLTLNAYTNGLVVVVHVDNPTNQISKRQLIDLYMGKYVAFPSGDKAQPIDGPNSMREEFYKTLVGMSLPQINSYWSRVRFTGRATPPISYNSMEFIQDYIAENRNAIAYINVQDVTNNMKVVYRFE